MHIRRLELQTHDLPAQQQFYGERLGLPIIAANEQSVELQMGKTRLAFKQAPADWQGVYHFALNIPENLLPAAKRWLTRSAPTLQDSSGADEFNFQSWNAHALYFSDAAGNIVEFIARHDLPNRSEQPHFDARQILVISEIGLATDDVPTMVELLRSRIGVEVYRGSGSETFAAVGDEHGLLIVVQRGREWYPETGKAAELLPVKIWILNDAGREYLILGTPYRIAAVD